MPAPLLHVDLTAGYGRATVLHDVAFTLSPGECLGLVGSSGSGKSTLVLALLGLLPWRQGWAQGYSNLVDQNLLTLPERELRKLRGRRIALVPQSPLSALNPSLTLRKHFREAWRAHQPSNAGLDLRITQLLDQLQLPADATFLDRKPGQISVGQAQRIVLALALLHRPSVLIADEPTSALDPVTQSETIRLLRRIQREENLALVYISHDLISVLQLSDHIGVLAQGRLHHCGATGNLTEDSAHPELRHLLRSLPVPFDALRNHLCNTVTPGRVTPEGTVTDSVVEPVCAFR